MDQSVSPTISASTSTEPIINSNWHTNLHNKIIRNFLILFLVAQIGDIITTIWETSPNGCCVENNPLLANLQANAPWILYGFKFGIVLGIAALVLRLSPKVAKFGIIALALVSLLGPLGNIWSDYHYFGHL